MDQTYMKKKPILPLLMSMALPMIISMFVNSLYNIVDSIFVAKISEEAMTALSLVYPVQNLVTSISVGFGVGINAMIAMFLGSGNEERAGAAATQGTAAERNPWNLIEWSRSAFYAILFANVYFRSEADRSWHALFCDRSLFFCRDYHRDYF